MNFAEAINGKKSTRTAKCFRADHEESVRPNCVITPTEMYKMVEQGIPVSLPNRPDQFDDGDTTNNFEVPIERIRGIDVNDIYEATWDARQKVKRAHLEDRRKYGD